MSSSDSAPKLYWEMKPIHFEAPPKSSIPPQIESRAAAPCFMKVGFVVAVTVSSSVNVPVGPVVDLYRSSVARMSRKRKKSVKVSP